MPVVDLELTGFLHGEKRAGSEQLAIVEERRGELANDLQEMLGQGAAQASLFVPAAREHQSGFAASKSSEALERLGIPLP
jgi:hypothetical protein